MDDRVILRVGAKVLIPFILLFALYVQFHGDYGPGGGFQAGVIFAAGFVLYALIYGLENVKHVLPPKVAYTCAASGVLLYAGVGYLTMVLGGEFLDYGVLAHDPEHGQHPKTNVANCLLNSSTSPRDAPKTRMQSSECTNGSQKRV